MSTHDKHNYNCSEECDICNGQFTETNYKVRDHCHITGSDRGAAPTKCNIHYYNHRY